MCGLGPPHWPQAWKNPLCSLMPLINCQWCYASPKGIQQRPLLLTSFMYYAFYLCFIFRKSRASGIKSMIHMWSFLNPLMVKFSWQCYPMVLDFSSTRGQTHWNHTHRKLVNLITLGPQPSLTQWNQAMPMGQPKTGGSWCRGVTECGQLEKGMANHFSILALRTPWTVWKGKMIAYQKRNSPGH